MIASVWLSLLQILILVPIPVGMVRFRPRVGPHGERLRPRRRKARLSSRQRSYAVYRTIHRRTQKGKTTTVPQLAGWHHVTQQTIRRYLKQRQQWLMRKWPDQRIEVVNGRYRIISLTQKERQRFEQAAPTTSRWGLRFGTTYKQAPERSVTIDGMIPIRDRNQATIKRAIGEINEALRDHHFGGLVDAGVIEYGTVPATPPSGRFFWYKHHGDAKPTWVWGGPV